MACGGEKPATTPTLPPVQDVQTLCLEVQQSYPQIAEEFSLPIAGAVRDILAGMGLQVVPAGAACDATLTLVLTGTALGEHYTELFTVGPPRDLCYTGAEVSGEMTIMVPGRAPLTLSISQRSPPISGTITWCPYEREAPFGSVWPRAVLDGLTLLWPPRQVFLQAVEAEEWWVRLAAVTALGRMGLEEGVVAALIRALADEEILVRVNAASKLGEIGAAEGVVLALIRALADEYPEMRAAAASALGKIGPEASDAVPALTKAMEDEHPQVRDEAERALGSIQQGH